MAKNLIKTRISIGTKIQGDIAFFYTFNDFKNCFNIVEDNMFLGKHFIEIGSTFFFNGNKYKVRNIQTLYYSKICGANTTSLGEQVSEYNFETAYFVDLIE